MKIIFQDIDGALNDFDVVRIAEHGRRTRLSELISSIGRVYIERLNRIVEATGAQVVISSTWRKWYTLEEMNQAFKTHGFVGNILGMTPVLDARRGLEIEEWLQTNKNSFKVEKIVIIDDDSDMEHLMDRLVKTSMHTGMTDEHVERAIEMLKDE